MSHFLSWAVSLLGVRSRCRLRTPAGCRRTLLPVDQLGGLGRPWLAVQADAETEGRVRGALDAFNEMLAERDLEGTLALFVSDADVSLVGSEAGEIAIGQSELRSFFERIFRRAGTFSFDWRSCQVSAHGDVAWFFADATAIYTEGENVTTVPYRTTGILQRENNRWLIVHYHGSEPAQAQP